MLTITTLPSDTLTRKAHEIWSVLSTLTVSKAESLIVANSKALHHVLPHLMPPIDHEYTLKFFYNRKNLSINEDEAFLEMYVEFHRIAVENSQEIASRIGKRWHTSESKVIDNAIVGYMRKRKIFRPA